VKQSIQEKPDRGHQLTGADPGPPEKKKKKAKIFQEKNSRNGETTRG